jgi:hypothetical protein
MYVTRTQVALHANESRISVQWVSELEVLVPSIGFAARQMLLYSEPNFTAFWRKAAEEQADFLDDVLNEVMDLFPSTFIHVGGDEAIKDQWKASPKIQAKIKELGLKDEHELQSDFVQRIEKFVNSKGRKIIGWDEILEGGLAPNAAVMSWRGTEGGVAAASGGAVVIASAQITVGDRGPRPTEARPTVDRLLWRWRWCAGCGVTSCCIPANNTSSCRSTYDCRLKANICWCRCSTSIAGTNRHIRHIGTAPCGSEGYE